MLVNGELMDVRETTSEERRGERTKRHGHGNGRRHQRVGVGKTMRTDGQTT